LVDALQFTVVEFDEDARHAGEVRALLASRGTPIGPYDVLIAGQAKARNLTLVTHNTDEFGNGCATVFQDDACLFVRPVVDHLFQKPPTPDTSLRRGEAPLRQIRNARRTARLASGARFAPFSFGANLAKPISPMGPLE
jgi:hypothetical protein